uniref:Transmembrane protein 59 n=1 Tax=Anser brachyrhynchus TaxID=132585 RepID=A0A8B9B7I2_9AVES
AAVGAAGPPPPRPLTGRDPPGTCPEGLERGLPQGRGLRPGAAGALRGAGPPHHEALHAAALPSRKPPCSSAARQAPLGWPGPSRREDYISQQAARGGGGGGGGDNLARGRRAGPVSGAVREEEDGGAAPQPAPAGGRRPPGPGRALCRRRLVRGFRLRAGQHGVLPPRLPAHLLPAHLPQACTEAYSQSDEQYACHLGCQNQLPFAELRQEQLMSLMPRIHLLFPLTLVRSFWSDMMDSAQSFITSSWTFYLQADDGKIVIFQSKPEVQYVPQLEQETGDARGSLSLSKTADLRPGSSQMYRGLFEEHGSDSLFKCLSINSSWILTTTLVLSVLVLLWICCATVATAVEQYVPSEKLSIYGDLEYMNEQKLSRYPSSALVVVRCKTEEHEEAGPLPTKVNLAQSAI